MYFAVAAHCLFMFLCCLLALLLQQQKALGTFTFVSNHFHSLAVRYFNDVMMFGLHMLQGSV